MRRGQCSGRSLRSGRACCGRSVSAGCLFSEPQLAKDKQRAAASCGPKARRSCGPPIPCGIVCRLRRTIPSGVDEPKPPRGGPHRQVRALARQPAAAPLAEGCNSPTGSCRLRSAAGRLRHLRSREGSAGPQLHPGEGPHVASLRKLLPEYESHASAAGRSLPQRRPAVLANMRALRRLRPERVRAPVRQPAAALPQPPSRN